MTFNWWTFLFEVLNFVVLAYVLHRLLYRPLHEAIDARRATDAQVRLEAEKVQQEALALQKQLAEERTDQEQQRQDLLRKSREQAEADRRRILAETEETARHRQDELGQALQRKREESLLAVRAEVIRQAVSLSERLLRESVGKGLQHQLAQRLAETLEEVPAEQREQLGREWTLTDGAVLETAGELENDSVQPIQTAVEKLLGQEVRLTVRTLPELVGGVRLRLGGHVWDASLVGQMEEVRTRD